MNRLLYNSYTLMKKDAPPNCFLTSIHFLKGHFSITGYECGTEYRTDEPIVNITPAIWDTEVKN